jgi:hypothetical protein
MSPCCALAAYNSWAIGIRDSLGIICCSQSLVTRLGHDGGERESRDPSDDLPVFLLRIGFYFVK